jgi:glycosyltransferase involved in cell wall biosynthesis
MASREDAFSAIFDVDFYTAQLADEAIGDPVEHYKTIGHSAALDPSPYVSSAWLSAQLGKRQSDPLTAWLDEWPERRIKPHPCLDLDTYLDENSDVAEKGLNPLVHWLTFGRSEGRRLPGSELCAVPQSARDDHLRFHAYASTTASRLTPRRVLFVLGSTAPSGGNHVIFQFADHLKGLGWEVQLLATRDNESWGWHHLMTRLSFIEFDELDGDLFDVAIATTWTTVYNLPYVPTRRWAYLVQSIESRFFSQPIHQSLASLAEATYALRLPTVTGSTWLSTYLLNAHASPSTTILPGVDREVFNEAGAMLEPKPPDATRVLVEGSLTSTFKRVPESIEAAVALAGIELWHVGSTSPEPLTGVSKSFGNVSQLRLAEIYRSCDILVRLSRVEGLGMTPLEMFHCGGTAVTSDVTGHEDYMIDGHNCLVINTNQPEQARGAITRLAHDQDLLGQLKANARNTASSWPDWPTASTRFAAFLDTLIRTGPTPSSEIVEMTRRLGAQLANTTEFDHA